MPAPITLGVDVTGLKDLAKSLKAADPKLAKQFRAAMKQGGDLVAAAARSNASWSQRIPGTIKATVTSGGARVAVKAGGPNAPHAAPLEGSKGPTFRHPVFGHRKTWVTQKARPYLVPALQSHLDQITGLVADAIDGII